MPKQLVINLSMYNRSKSGMNKFSENVAGILEKLYPSVIITGHYKPSSPSSIVINAPTNIGINSGVLPAIKRLFVKYDLSCYPNKIIYSPTHHNIFSEKKMVITIHDFISYSYPKQHPLQYLYFKFYLPLLVKKCSYIITVSETVKKKIAKAYNFPLDKIFVIPNYVSKVNFDLLSKKKESEKKYLLVVGASYPHKNIDELLFNNVLWKEKYDLKIIGPSNNYQNRLKKIVFNEGLQKNVSFLSSVSEEEIQLYFKNCDALIYPSIDEGFGIPPLEALMYNKPSIISDIPVHREIFDSAAIFVKLGNKDSWEKAFFTLESENNVFEILLNGKKVVEKYSQSRVEETIKNTFDKILDL